MDRREFSGQILRSLFAFSFFDFALSRVHGFPGLAKDEEEIVRETKRLAGDVFAGRILGTDWQTAMEKLYYRADIKRFSSKFDFDALRAKAWKPPFDGLAEYHLRPFRIEAEPGRFVVVRRNLFYVDSGRAIVPHGHDNVVSITMALTGRSHVMHYDRLEERPDGLIITPTQDRIFAPGDLSTISDAKDNVHWFKTVSPETAIFFNLNLASFGMSIPHRFRSERRYVDLKGPSLGNGKILASLVDEKKAHELYNSLK